jgi:hypothetical protein
MPRPNNELLILGADGMNRRDPTPFVRGEDGTPWPMLELVNVDATELPVITGRLCSRDPLASTATTWPRRRDTA